MLTRNWLGEGESRARPPTSRARQKHAPPTYGPELKLWLELRARRFEGAKFRRQVVIGHYIADFACRTPTMLIVEIDGDTHADRETADAARTRFLEARGYRVVRFTNDEVMGNVEGVLFAIGEALRTPPLPNPLP